MCNAIKNFLTFCCLLFKTSLNGDCLSGLFVRSSSTHRLTAGGQPRSQARSPLQMCSGGKIMTSQAVQGPCCPSPRLAMYGLSSSPKGAVFLSGFLYSTLIYVLFRNQKCDLSEILNYFFTFIFFLPSKNLQVTQNQEKNYKMIVRM